MSDVMEPQDPDATEPDEGKPEGELGQDEPAPQPDANDDDVDKGDNEGEEGA